MKSIIIYFSLTGNTEMVARAIQTGIKKAEGNCDIVKIKEANPRRLYQYDLIGLGSPVFGLEPDNVKDFINNMRFVGGKHIFAFTTHGTHGELFFPRVVPLMKQRGLIVIGMRDWYGSVYLTGMPKPYPTDGHPDEIDLKEAEDFGKEMVERSRRISAGETKLIPPLPELGTSSKEFIDMVKASKFESMLKFHEEKCLYPKCRLCMANCPMDGIDLSVKPPVIAKPCTHCEFCFRVCPTGAIDGDEWVESIAAMASDEKGREWLFAHLTEAESQGRFRRLVPVEKIGYDTPIYKVYKKHPQWIIGKGLPYKHPQ